MIKRVVTAGITMAFSVSVLITPLCAEAAITPGKTYRDTTGHWSLQVVEESSAIGLMKGYPGNYFKPEGLVSRLEAIAIIIRAMGLEEQALKTKAAGSGITMPPGMTWGQGHLVLAAQKGLLSKEYVPALKYRDPITRAEVATLVAVALNIKGDATKLTYADNSSILELYKPYVAAVTEKNIMNGLGKNEFGPNQSMKRGQMAALMVTVSKDGWFKYGADRLISGTVVSLDATTGLLVIRKSDGTVLQKVLSGRPAIFNGSSAAALADIKYGTPVVAGVSDTGVVQYLEITSTVVVDNNQTPDSTVTGKVTVSPGAAGSSITIAAGTGSGKSYTLAPEPVVKDQFGTVSLSSVTSGKYITAQVKNNLVTTINILPTISVDGEIQSVSPTSLKISNSEGSYNYVLKSSETKVSGVVGSISGLKTGNKVKVISYQGQALEIDVSSVKSSGNKMEGVVTELDTGSSPEITVEDEDGDEETFEITDDTDFTRDGDDIDLDEIMIGAEVEIEYDDDEALEIEITNNEDDITLEGEVIDVDEDDDTIKIKQDSGSKFTIDVDRNCDFDNDATSASVRDLGDIRVGWTVKIKLQDSEATDITVADDDGISSGDEIEGVVTDLVTAGSRKKITVKDEDDDEETYDITNDTEITRDNDDIAVDNIMIGAEVRVTFDDDEALEIEVTNDSDGITVEGIVTAVDEDDDTVTIEQDSGERFRLDVGRNCHFRDYVDNDVDDLGDVRNGWQVRLILEDEEVDDFRVMDK